MTSGTGISALYREFTAALTEVLAENVVGPARRGRLARIFFSGGSCIHRVEAMLTGRYDRGKRPRKAESYPSAQFQVFKPQ